jgi:hypothetical protein
MDASSAGRGDTVDQSAATDRAGEESGQQMPSVADYWPSPPTGVLPRPRTDPRHAADDQASGADVPAPGADVPAPGADVPAPGADVPAPDADPAHSDDGITWIGPPENRHGRARLTLGGVIALILLVVIGGVLTAMIRQAHAHLKSSAASPQVVPPASVPTGGATIAPVPATTPSIGPYPSPASSAPSVPPVAAGKGRVPNLPAAATFEMAATDSSVTVVSRDLGTDLYRVTLAPSDAPVSASVSDTAPNHRLTLVKDPETPAPPVTITLSSAVSWSLKLSGGNTEAAANLTGARLASLELAGGAHIFTLTLPTVTGTFPLRITHGMNQLTINTHGVPVRLTLRTGAGKVILDGETRTDTKPGRVLTSDAFDAATNRVDVDSVEGVGTLIVNTA